jgi:peptide/nickel transport system ATP-binding protein
VEEISETIIKVINLKKYFGPVKAVDGISFEINRGETFGLVGESGSGKSTTGKTILRLYPKTGGDIFFQDRDIFKLNKRELRKLRPKMQMIFQGTKSSLNPRMTVGNLISEALLDHKLYEKGRLREVTAAIMEKCGLSPRKMDCFPHEFSGGERQRIGIARALVLKPDFIVADEPVSSLDVSIQSQIINLLGDLQEEYGLTYLFISHDLSLVEHISQKVGIMYLGSLVEIGPTSEVFQNPAHPYTKALLSAIPGLSPLQKRERIILQGEMPSPIDPPAGCIFHTRCSYAQEKCRKERPVLKDFGCSHKTACHFIN